MDYNFDYLSIVRKMVSPHRFNHTLGVIKEAIRLSKIYNVDSDKARIAATLHDISKNKDINEIIANVKNNYDPIVLSYPVGTIHAYDSRLEAIKLGVDDEEILKAIESHALARPNMSTLEKIIMLRILLKKDVNLVNQKSQEI